MTPTVLPGPTKQLPSRTPNAFGSFLDRYRDHFGRFVEEVLGATLQPWQREVADAIDHGIRRLAIRSGHRVGKSTLLAWLLWHQLLTRFPQKSAVTAPSEKQLFDALWAEFQAWGAKLPPTLRQLVKITADRAELLEAPSESFVSIKVARPEATEALHGMYAPNVLLIADEASGVSDAHFEAGTSSLANPHVLFVITGNPLRTQGFFYDAFHKVRDLWHTVHVSSTASPYAAQDYIQFVARKYGEDSNAYRTRVLGEFPVAEEDKVIPRDLILAAVGRNVEPVARAAVIWGVDVGIEDRTALAKRRANGLLEPVRHWRKADTMETAGRLKHEWDVTPLADRPSAICVDAIGLGRGVADRLRELELPARAINVSEAPALKNAHYKDLRSELWFEVRQWFANRDTVIPDQEDLVEELAAPDIRYFSNGRTGVEAKDSLRRRGLNSPDLADALCLTFAVDSTILAFGLDRKALTTKPLHRDIGGLI